MYHDNYFLPETCIAGKEYYIKAKGLDANTKVQNVEFVAYCPNPAEVIVRKDGKNKVIHRVYLLQKKGRK